jgi:hypothetical protein
MSFKIVDAKPINTWYMLIGSGGVSAGGLVAVSGGKGVAAAADFANSTIVGIARETTASASYCYVDLIEDHELEADFTGSSKTSVAVTDTGTVFDLSTALVINLDDTTSGSFVAGFGSATFWDNTNYKIRGKYTHAARYV